METAENIRFNVIRNALYHTARRRSAELWSRIFSFIIIALGTAAMSDLAGGIGIPAIVPGALVALAGAAQLVFDFAGQARTHQQLQRQYYELLADMEESLDPAEQDLARWRADMIRITSDEPPIYRAIDAKAYNDAIDAADFDAGERLTIPWHHNILGHLWHFDGHRYVKLCEK